MPIYAEYRSPQREAHYQVARAIRKGDLSHPRNFRCADCAGPAAEYDHRDYTKPLLVAPVCRKCNCRRGSAIGAVHKGRLGWPSRMQAEPEPKVAV